MPSEEKKNWHSNWAKIPLLHMVLGLYFATEIFFFETLIDPQLHFLLPSHLDPLKVHMVVLCMVFSPLTTLRH